MKNMKIELDKILKVPITLYEKFHSQTALQKTLKHTVKALRIYHKAYDRFPAIHLNVKRLPPKSLSAILADRHSQRDVDLKKATSFDKISSLLYYSAGIHTNKNPFEGYRFYPSAGGRFPLEVYLIPNRIEGLMRGGVYHYNTKGKYLEERLPTKKESLKQCFQQPFVHKSGGVIIITAIFKRTTMKYGERGYRYVHLEAGHLGQNLYLVGAALGLGMCGICGFYDDPLNKYLHIDGVTESALYCFTVNP